MSDLWPILIGTAIGLTAVYFLHPGVANVGRVFGLLLLII